MIDQTLRIARSALLGIAMLLPIALPVTQAKQATPEPAMSVAADGLASPRGVTWGTDGTMFVAVSGIGGDSAGPEGSPFSGGMTASVAMVRDGTVTTLADGLPSSVWSDIDWVWGVMDVAVLGDQLYALDGGGGAIHGNPDTPSGIYRIDGDGTATLVADLGTWVDENPVEFTPPEGAPNNGSFFGMIAMGDALWVSESVNGQVLRVTLDGEISRIADLSEDHLVPTGIAAAQDGGAYVGYLTPAPYGTGTAKIAHIAPDGTVTDAWSDLTTVTGVAVGADGTIYAAEMSAETTDSEPFLTANTGRILHQTSAGEVEEIASGLDSPVNVRIGPDGALYVSTPAYGSDDGTGQILRIPVAGS